MLMMRPSQQNQQQRLPMQRCSGTHHTAPHGMVKRNPSNAERQRAWRKSGDDQDDKSVDRFPRTGAGCWPIALGFNRK